MKRLVAMSAQSGVGKTTLLHALAARGDFVTGLEQHTERPFQKAFEMDRRFALANQLDYLLFRAGQEKQLGLDPRTAITDGGLDMDFHGFTRLFHAHRWLTDSEFELCGRFYHYARGILPPPDLIIALSASAASIQSRLSGRSRINIASPADAYLLDQFLDEWLESLSPGQVLRFDVSNEPADYSSILERILAVL